MNQNKSYHNILLVVHAEQEPKMQAETCSQLLAFLAYLTYLDTKRQRPPGPRDRLLLFAGLAVFLTIVAIFANTGQLDKIGEVMQYFPIIP